MLNSTRKSIRRYVLIALSIAIMILFKFVEPPSGLSSNAMAVVGVFLGTLILWLFVSIDWPSLLCILMLGILANLDFKTLFSASFGSDTFVFLFCTFICTYALSKTNIVKNIAIWFVSNRLAKKGPWWFVTMFFFSVIFLGCFMSPSVLFVVLLPILESIYKIAGIEKNSKVSSMLMMGLAFCVSISSGMTPIAHVFPVISFGIYEQITGASINYASYMAMAIPVGIVVTILMILMFRVILRPDVEKLKNIDIDALKQQKQKLNKADIITLIIFCVMIAIWVLPSLLQNVWNEFYTLFNGYTTAFASLVGVVLMCIVHINGKPIVSIKEATSGGVPFSSIIMCAGTLALSSALTSDSIGLVTYITQNLSTVLSSLSPYLLVCIFAFWALLQTNFSSNMVTATVVTTVAVPIIFAVSQSGTINVTATVAAIVGMLSAYAFMTPPSMPHIAIASASGWSNTKHFLAYGTILAIFSLILSVTLGYFIGIALF